jgi:hypothetical protein
VEQSDRYSSKRFAAHSQCGPRYQQCEDPPRRVLLAAPPDVIRDIGPVLAADVELLATDTLDAAISRLHAEKPDAIVMCYAFDQTRPHRLLHYIQQEWRGANLPIILIRALPISLGKLEESQLREAYQSLGVRTFFDLCAQQEQIGREEALKQFRESVLQHLGS